MSSSAVDVARQSVECSNAGDFDRMRSLYTADSYEEELATQRRLEGVDAQIDAARGWKQAFPDARGTIHGVYADGRTVTLELTWQGTQDGALQTPDGHELPPSHRRAAMRDCQVTEIEEGKIAATRHYFDLMTLMQQLGAMERAGTTA